MTVSNEKRLFLASCAALALVIYGLMLRGQEFPPTERVSLGIGNKEAVASLLSPFYFIVCVCMLLSAATELGTNQRIESLLRSTGVNALLVLAFINGIMMIGRAVAPSQSA
jgi:hypothetical protein